MTSNAQLAFEQQLALAWPCDQWRDAHVLLAVSGGADSVALLRAVLALKNMCGGRGAIHAAHLNHALRGEVAAADQAWLEELCRRLGVLLVIGQSDIRRRAAERRDGLEAAAREARYEFLRSTAEQIGARFVATAHTADDQAETVLHRILRGTGLAGLAGIPPSRPLSSSVTLVRPLLAATRTDVLEYLAALGQDYRTDASNADLNFTRNRIRHELLPLIREHFNPEARSALQRLALQAAEIQQWIGGQAERLADECVIVEPSGPVRLACQPLAAQPEFLVREVCKVAWSRAGWPMQAVGFDEWQRLARLVFAERDAPPSTCPATSGPAAVLASWF